MEESFRHEAVLYLGEEEFLADTLPFVAEGLDAGEPIMVAVEQPKIELLKRELGADASRVRFRDMLELGRNPARIISAWCDFAAEHREGGSSLRGIGEPAWPGRSEAELEECDHHESLLNVAFGDGPEFSLLCPYDVRGLDTDVVRSALRTHPTLTINGSRVPSNASPASGPARSRGRCPIPRVRPTSASSGRTTWSTCAASRPPPPSTSAPTIEWHGTSPSRSTSSRSTASGTRAPAEPCASGARMTTCSAT